MTLTNSIARFLCPGSGTHFDQAWPCHACQDTAERIFRIVSDPERAPHDPEQHPGETDPYYVHVVPRPDRWQKCRDAAEPYVEELAKVEQRAVQRLAREQD